MKTFLIVLAAMFSAAVLVAGLWAWQQTEDWVLNFHFGRPVLAEWAMRSATVALMAGAELMVLFAVIGRLFRGGVFDSALRFTAGAVAVLAGVGAIACGLAGR